MTDFLRTCMKSIFHYRKIFLGNTISIFNIKYLSHLTWNKISVETEFEINRKIKRLSWVLIDFDSVLLERAFWASICNNSIFNNKKIA